MMTMNRRALMLRCLTAILLTQTRPAEAGVPNELNRQLGSACQKAANWLGNKSTAINIVKPSPSRHPLSHLTPDMLHEAVKEHFKDFSFAADAPCQIVVQFSKQPTFTPAGYLRELSIELIVYKGKEVKRFPCPILDSELLLQLHIPKFGDGPMQDLAHLAASAIARKLSELPDSPVLRFGTIAGPGGYHAQLSTLLQEALGEERVRGRPLQVILDEQAAAWRLDGELAVSFTGSAGGEAGDFPDIVLALNIQPPGSQLLKLEPVRVNTDPRLHPNFGIDRHNFQGIAQVVGKSVALDPKLPVRDNLRRFQDDPVVTLDTKTGVIRTSEDSPYGLRILAGLPNNPSTHRPIVIDMGKGSVTIGRGEEYQLEIYNESKHWAAATVFIDGLSMFQFAREARLRHQVLFIPPESSSLIPGWFRDDRTSDAFLVDRYAGSAAEQVHGLPAPDNRVGLILVGFFRAYADGEMLASDEPIKPQLSDGTATHRGRNIEKSYKSVSMRVGADRGVIGIRYSASSK